MYSGDDCGVMSRVYYCYYWRVRIPGKLRLSPIDHQWIDDRTERESVFTHTKGCGGRHRARHCCFRNIRFQTS